MFQRFTERARQVPVLAQEEARSFGHDFIGTEHLLLGLLREEDGLAARVLAARVLADLGVTVEHVRARVREIVGSGEPGQATGQIPFTARAKRALEVALREALGMGHNHIGTEHLLLGVVQDDEAVAAVIMRELGADADTVRNAIGETLGGPRPGRRRGPPPRWRRRRGVYGALSEARDAALEEGNYDLARKLLELEIEEREKQGRAEGEAEPPPA
jgi:ATP-dependent Clp protease ATP-binding subunit ClpC